MNGKIYFPIPILPISACGTFVIWTQTLRPTPQCLLHWVLIIPKSTLECTENTDSTNDQVSQIINLHGFTVLCEYIGLYLRFLGQILACDSGSYIVPQSLVLYLLLRHYYVDPNMMNTENWQPLFQHWWKRKVASSNCLYSILIIINTTCIDTYLWY